MALSKRDTARLAKLAGLPVWQWKALQATRGTRFGAILACASERYYDAAPATPRFVGRASVTSDGFVMCNFVDQRGNGHRGAFVGAIADLNANVSGLADHLALNDAERLALGALISRWIGADYRGGTR